MKLTGKKDISERKKLDKEIAELEKKEKAVQAEEAVKLRPSIRTVLLSVTVVLCVGVVVFGYFLVRKLMLDERYTKSVGIFETSDNYADYEFNYQVEPNKDLTDSDTNGANDSTEKDDNGILPGENIKNPALDWNYNLIGSSDGKNNLTDGKNVLPNANTPSSSGNNPSYDGKPSSDGKKPLSDDNTNGKKNNNDEALTGSALGDADDSVLSDSKDNLVLDNGSSDIADSVIADSGIDDSDIPNVDDYESGEAANIVYDDNGLPEWPDDPSDWNDDPSKWNNVPAAEDNTQLNGADDNSNLPLDDSVSLSDYLSQMDKSNMESGVDPEEVTLIDPEMWLH